MTMTGSTKYLPVWMLLILVILSEFVEAVDKIHCQREPGLHYDEDKKECISCVRGLNYNDGTIKDGCANCTVPGPGFYTEKNCTAEMDTIVRRCPNNTYSLSQTSRITDCINYTQLITLKQCKNLQPAPDTGDACNCGVLVFVVAFCMILSLIIMEFVCIVILYVKRNPWFGKVLKRLSKRFDETPEDVPTADITSDNSDFANVQERAAADDALDEENQPMHFPSQASGDHESEESFIPVRR